MRVRGGLLLLGWLLQIALAAAGGAAESQRFECQFGEAARRVVLDRADDADGLPCRVLYWRDARGEPQVIWRADTDFEFCRFKTEDLVSRLEQAGWQCSPAQGEISESTEAAAPAPAEVPSLRTTLKAAILRDLQRLDRLTRPAGGRFQVTSLRVGDLDRDGREDAAVLLTYKARGKLRAYYLIAYVFDGRDFRPVARKNVAGAEVSKGQIRAIEEGAVQLRLWLPQPDDPACCPSTYADMVVALMGQQLVQISPAPETVGEVPQPDS